MKTVLLFAALALSSECGAGVYCNGKVSSIYKWNNMTSLSIQIAMSDGTTTNYINLPTKSDEALALSAFSMDKPVSLYWSASDVTVCSNGWAHNRGLEGFIEMHN